MKENILAKYNRLRPKIKHGDTMLVHGTRFVSRVIQECDSDAYWNHILIIIEISGVLFCIDSNAPGVDPQRLSVRIKDYAEKDGADFMIRRSYKSEEEIHTAFFNVMQGIEKVGKVKYDFRNGIKSLLNRYIKTGFKIKPLANEKICSVFVYPYELELEMITETFSDRTLFFPQDFERYKKNVIDIC